MTGGSRPNEPIPSDSREALARSIARAVQSRLPADESVDELTRSADASLREEAQRNELLLAWLRTGFLLGLAVLSFVASEWPELERVPIYPLAPGLALAVWSLVALALLLALRHGWYPDWLRRGLPLFDAAIISTTFLALERGLDPVPVPGGYIALVATACVFLAFSGPLRLSRRSSRLAGVLGVAVWLMVALLVQLGLFQTLVIGGTIAATGVLGTRVTRGIRRVVTMEVSRMRLENLYRKAQETIDAREEVLRIVSHDLRNPLGTIAMATDLLLSIDDTPEKRNKHLGIIKRSGERAHRLVRDLLDAARLEAGRLPIDPRTVPLNSLLDDVVDMMGPLAEDASLELLVAPHDELPAVHVDPERMLQVYSNLIGNAIKFTPKGGQIVLRAERLGEKVRLGVRDTGPGIPPEEVEKIFSRLWQANRGDGRGIGLGLTIARAIVEAHDERIGVDSTPGEGTEFWFTAAISDSE